MKRLVDYSLYLCTDRELMTSKTLEECVERAILGGVTCVQLREKQASSLEFYEEAKRVLQITKTYGVPLIINDRVDIALAIDADGVHIGQSDLPANEVRRLLGKEKIVGVSARNVKEALEAYKAGADYLGVGAMFSTSTKTDAEVVSKEELKNIQQKVNLPIVLIGGMNARTIPEFLSFKVQGFAVVSAIVSEKNVTHAAQELKKIISSSDCR